MVLLLYQENLLTIINQLFNSKRKVGTINKESKKN